MSGFDYRSGGRRVSKQEFFRNMEKKAIDLALSALADKVQGIASAIVDPATGKHADVFVRRHGETIMISTRGSPTFARELERRLGVESGTVKSASPDQPNVYLAHASEDHETLAKPLAERLMAAGIEVWLDGWEIRPGDSLKRKMEEGLDACTHFLVLLTPCSLGKAWVETEIDAGFMRAVEGKSKFIGLRIDVPITQLSPFLQTRHCPEIALGDDAQLKGLVADIYGASRKPQAATWHSASLCQKRSSRPRGLVRIGLRRGRISRQTQPRRREVRSRSHARDGGRRYRPSA